MTALPFYRTLAVQRQNSSRKDLDIIFQYNFKITHYLDITLNINNGSYRPYRKLNKETNYIHVNSDHLSSIIKEIT